MNLLLHNHNHLSKFRTCFLTLGKLGAVTEVVAADAFVSGTDVNVVINGWAVGVIVVEFFVTSLSPSCWDIDG